MSSRLNLSRRGRPEATDILSFPARAASPRLGAGRDLGDLALNLQYAWRRRGRFFRRFETEAAFLAFHGLLHLCGRHHDNPVQQRMLDRLQARHFPPPEALLDGLRPLKRSS